MNSVFADSFFFFACISFLVMTQRGIQDALTADHHYEQAGFTALLK
jgi:predicted nucleic acid-binding protein